MSLYNETGLAGLQFSNQTFQLRKYHPIQIHERSQNLLVVLNVKNDGTM